jgi:hypothetical protein
MTSSKKIKIIFSICILILLIISINILYTGYQELSDLSKEKKSIQNELDSRNQDLLTVKSEIKYIQRELIKTRENLNKSFYEVEMRRSDGVVEISNPTYSDAMVFIRADKTDKKKYVEGSFTCTHFSLEVKNNAEKNGIRCGYVVVNLSGGERHALIAFNTTDKGILYIEPQTDAEVNLRVEKDYWADCLVVRSSRYYYRSDPDNIVQDFDILFW